MGRNSSKSWIISVSCILFSILSFRIANISSKKLPFQLELKTNKAVEPIQLIRIALSVDEDSIKDFMIVMNSVLSSSQNSSALVFHIISCGKDIDAAISLQTKISIAIKSCFPLTVRYHIVAFTLPPNSGFDRQLKSGMRNRLHLLLWGAVISISLRFNCDKKIEKSHHFSD